MSRSYRMFVTVTESNDDREHAIRAAMSEEWSFDDWHVRDGVLTADGEGSLGGGETPEEFSERLAQAIWKANDGFCRVDVETACLDDLPTDAFDFDESDYTRLVSAAVAEPARELAEPAPPPPEPVTASRRYDVHLFPVARVKLANIEAASPEAAIGKALEVTDLYHQIAAGSAEFAEEISHFLVDVVGDSEYEQSRWFYTKEHPHMTVLTRLLDWYDGGQSDADKLRQIVKDSREAVECAV